MKWEAEDDEFVWEKDDTDGLGAAADSCKDGDSESDDKT